MGMAIDWYNEIIQITSPTTEVDGQVLHDFIEDQMSSPIGLGYSAIIQPEGKVEDPSNPGIYSQIIIILNSPWQIQFWGGSGYTRIYGAKIVGGLSDQPLKATGTANDITVLESPVDGLTVTSGSGVTEQDKLDIADRVHDEVMTGHTVLGSLSQSLKHIQYLQDGIVVDAVEGSPGTDYPLGLHATPVSNWADAKQIAENEGIEYIHLHTDITIESAENINGYSFKSDAPGVTITLTPTCTTQGTKFTGLNVTGTASGVVWISGCAVYDLYGFKGYMQECILAGDIQCVAWAQVNSFFSCVTAGQPGTIVNFDLNGSEANIKTFTGQLKLLGKTTDTVLRVEFANGQIVIDASCTAGTITLKGIGRLSADNSGVGCTVETKDLVGLPTIEDQIWDAVQADHIAVNSMGGSSARTVGLTQENQFIDQQVYTSNKLTSARIRIYSIAGSVGTDSDVLATYTMTATYSGENLDTYKVVKA